VGALVPQRSYGPDRFSGREMELRAHRASQMATRRQATGALAADAAVVAGDDKGMAGEREAGRGPSVS